ncbi:MAG: hypothetical protein RR092_01965 [Oscillospiraceae bacterium]
MIVHTWEQAYTIVQVLRRTEQEEILVCRDLQENCYLLVRFQDQALNRRLLPMLVAQVNNKTFEDYLGLFSQDGDLYARFRYTAAPTLTERLAKGGDSLQARLLLAGNLLERMALLQMPPALQYEALRSYNLTVDDSLKVSFNYILDATSVCADMGLCFVCVRIAEIFREVFQAELAAKAVPELETYLTELERGSCTTYLEIYGGFRRVSELLRDRVPTGVAEPRTWLFRLWERIKRLRRYVVPLLGGLVLVAAFCYLIYTLLAPPTPLGTPVLFDSIGTVAIQQAELGEAPQPGETAAGRAG